MNEVADAPAQNFPRIHQLKEPLFSGDGPTLFRWKVDALIEGISQAPQPARLRPRANPFATNTFARLWS
ncbi:hypothetical protein [Streptomyces sp900116325]|uniref:hypothetical protein n=1 Tax=Streptomyces sp. 900116325 TaxID=3154295 RepID=UPI003329F609